MSIIRAHWGLVKTRRRGVQNMQAFYVDDKFVGTSVADVKKKLSDVPLRVLRLACDRTKAYDVDCKVYKDNGKWEFKEMVY